MLIEFRDLRWAITAAQYRSLRQAADVLNVRQSTLSRRLREIEIRLDVRLFERTNGGTHPTLAGLEFLEASRRILGDADAAFQKLKSRARGENGRLSIGIYASLTAGNMRATLVEHHRRFPDVDVHTVDGGHDRLLCALTGNEIDIAIMTICGVSCDSRMMPLWSERVIAALPERHAFQNRDVLHWDDLCHQRIILPEAGPGPELERLLNTRLQTGSPQRILHQDSGLDRLLSLVSAEYGALLMLEGGTGARYDGVTYREIHDDNGPTRLNFAAYWRDENSNPTLLPFLNLLRERYPDISAALGSM